MKIKQDNLCKDGTLTVALTIANLRFFALMLQNLIEIAEANCPTSVQSQVRKDERIAQLSEYLLGYKILLLAGLKSMQTAIAQKLEKIGVPHNTGKMHLLKLNLTQLSSYYLISRQFGDGLDEPTAAIFYPLFALINERVEPVEQVEWLHEIQLVKINPSEPKQLHQ